MKLLKLFPGVSRIDRLPPHRRFAWINHCLCQCRKDANAMPKTLKEIAESSSDDDDSSVESEVDWRKRKRKQRRVPKALTKTPCDVCKKIFSCKQRMLCHRMTHFGEQPPTCFHCGQEFAQKSTLLYHMKIHDKNRVKFSCKICSKTFSREYTSKLHAEAHTDKNEFTCSRCGEKFKTFARLRVHNLTHLGVDPYKCNDCGLTFAHNSVFKVHKLTHVAYKDKPIVCDICGARFTLESVMLRHRVVHDEKKPYACEECGLGFCQKSNYQKHMDKHAGIVVRREKKFECDVCHKKYRTIYSVNYHKNEVHNPEKQLYQCKICGERFKHKSNLQVHNLYHKGRQPLRCNFCNMEFAAQCSLKTHVKTHQSTKNFECEICNKKYATKIVLDSHKKLHSGIKPYKCNICGNSYTDKSKLNYHLKMKCFNQAYVKKMAEKGIILNVKFEETTANEATDSIDQLVIIKQEEISCKEENNCED